MPKPPPPQQLGVPGKSVTQGPIHRVPCPHCGQALNFQAHADADSGGAGWGEQGLETGARVDCDHCERTSKILAKEKITVIKLVAL